MALSSNPQERQWLQLQLMWVHCWSLHQLVSATKWASRKPTSLRNWNVRSEQSTKHTHANTNHKQSNDNAHLDSIANHSDFSDYTSFSSVCDWLSSPFPLLIAGEELLGHCRGLHLVCMPFYYILSSKSQDIGTMANKASLSKSLWTLVFTCKSLPSFSWRTVFVEADLDTGL